MTKRKEGPLSKGGRPPKYEEKYCEEIIKFFSKAPNYREKIKVKGKTVDGKLVANSLPTFAMFAVSIGTHRATVNKWVLKYPEFRIAHNKCKHLQEDFLMENGLKGLYNSTFAVFTAKNILRWTDRQEIKQEIKQETVLTANVEQIEISDRIKQLEELPIEAEYKEIKDDMQSLDEGTIE